MSTKTVQARSLPTRVAIAYAGTPEQPIHPVMATAYQRNGAVVIATVRWSGQDTETTEGRVREFKATDKVIYSSDPEAVEAHGLRYCRTCDERHLLRVGTDKYATLVCDVRARELGAARRAAKKAGTYKPAKQVRREETAARVNERIDAIIESAPSSRERMIATTLRNVIESDAYPTEEKKQARFETLARQYGMSVEAARQAVAEVA